MKGKNIKWLLFIWVLLMFIFNYHAFIEFLDQIVLVPFDNYIKTLGYYFSIRDPLLAIFNKLVPSLPVLVFWVNVTNKSFKETINLFYNKISNIQLVTLSIILPFLLYMQNLFFGDVQRLIKNNK